MSHVMCYVSGVMCQLSGVRFQVSGVKCKVSGVFFFFTKVVELLSGGSVINGAYPVQFLYLAVEIGLTLKLLFRALVFNQGLFGPL